MVSALCCKYHTTGIKYLHRQPSCIKVTEKRLLENFFPFSFQASTATSSTSITISTDTTSTTATGNTCSSSNFCIIDRILKLGLGCVSRSQCLLKANICNLTQNSFCSSYTNTYSRVFSKPISFHLYPTIFYCSGVTLTRICAIATVTTTTTTTTTTTSTMSSPVRSGSPSHSPVTKSKKKHEDTQKKSSLPLHGPGSKETQKLLNGILPVSEESTSYNTEALHNKGVSEELKQKLSELQVSSAMCCVTCGITFDDRMEQIEHFKTDWHRFNLKQRIKGAKCVSEGDFILMADNISSLSGTDSEDSEVEDNKLVSTLPDKRNLYDDSSSDEEEGNNFGNVVVGKKQNKIYLRTDTGQILSLYQAAILNKKEVLDDTEHLLRVVKNITSQNTWIIIMMGGGHFAAAVFIDGEAIQHKTFHRYIVRAKSGTAQSQHDKKGGHAQSAGAQIRRYNEAALAQEITDLLESWRECINKCHKIFVRVSTHNYPYIFNKKEKSHLNRHDRRLQVIPFPTRRATFNEVKRVYTELSSVRCYDPSSRVPGFNDRKKKPTSTAKRVSSNERRKRQEDPSLFAEEYVYEDEGDVELSSHDVTIGTEDLREHDRFIPSREEILQERSSERKRKSKSSCKDKCVDVEEEMKYLPYQSEFYTTCVVGDETVLSELINTHHASIAQAAGSFAAGINLPVNSLGQTLLHIASMNAHSDLVTYLLNQGCDPSISDSKKIVPYLCTQNKNVRNTFRFYMSDYPDKYDYIKAQIPGPLSKSEYEEKQMKETERRKEMNKKKKERSKTKKAEIAKQKAEDEEKKRFLALSDREKRALAAEKRLMEQAKLVGNPGAVLNRCHWCAVDITGKIPFEYSNNTFCSPSCLKAHRLNLKTH